ncbi:PAS domain-containing sensor histidine kinase [Tautonia marina]|uniref:PAS domain-containing sensor histidine kinase n=1 Tax=Tautonia marina TaxID=2653855 RepID=UPI00137641D6|nr:PAS domain-containing sensor histidine kinase [Tautonia marina]
MATLAMLKGIAFVLFTAVILYWKMTETLVGLETTRRDLAEVQERFRRAIVDAPIPVIIFAEDGEIVLLNQTWLESTGYSPEELKSISDWTERAYGARKAMAEEIIQNLFTMDQRIDEADFEIRIRDGSVRIWSFSSAPLGHLNDGRRLMISMARDVTDRRQAEDALRTSEERFRMVVESAPEGIFIQTQSKFAYVNSAAVKLFGAGEANEMLGQDVIRWFHPSEHESIRERIALINQNRQTGGRIERIILRPDGRQIETEISAIPIEYSRETGALVFIRDISDRKQAEYQLTESSNRLRELTRRLLSLQEAERRNLARELHDQIGQGLTAIKMNLQTAQMRPEVLTPRLNDAKALLDQTLDQVRSLSLDLRPSLLDDLGLVPALNWYLERFSERTGIQAQLHSESQGLAVSPLVATTCFRTAQEALTNVARHARASRVTVRLNCQTDQFDLFIRDDGVGFDPDQATGLGLIGMRERVEDAGGVLQIQSKPHAGTEIRLSFPPANASLEGRDRHDKTPNSCR